MWYAENVRAIIGSITLGMGTSDTSKYLGFLGLYGSQNRKAFTKLELEVGKTLRKIAKKVFKNNMLQEIKLTIEDMTKTMSFEKWNNLPDNHPEKPRAQLTVSFDMGWQKRGRSFNSNSGHAFLVGGKTRKVIAFLTCMKKCTVCEKYDKKNKEAPEHCCPRNYTGSSKGMEAFAGVQLVTEVWDTFHACVSQICANEDSTIHAQMKHLLKEKLQVD